MIELRNPRILFYLQNNKIVKKNLRGNKRCFNLLLNKGENMNNINKVIKSKGLTKKFVCDNLGINYSVMSGFINGSRKPSQDRLLSMSNFLEVKIEDLYPNATEKTIYEI